MVGKDVVATIPLVTLTAVKMADSGGTPWWTL